MDWILSSPCPPNSYVKAPTANVTVFEDKAFKGITKVKRDHKGGAPNPKDCKVRNTKSEHTQKKDLVRTQGEVIDLQVRKGGLTRNPLFRHLKRGLSGSRTMTEHISAGFLFFRSHLACDILLRKLEQTNTSRLSFTFLSLFYILA